MLKYLSLFSGIGAPEKALKNLGIEYELIGFSEIDKYAIKSYCAIHNVSEELNLGDITKIDIKSLPKDIDFITHGSPCTDLSLAGKEAGADKGSGTRSSLMWNSVEIFKHCKPKIILWENVKNLLSKKHKHNFDAYIEDLNNLGYVSYYKVLNAKDFGIPQNRERVFTISIRNDINKEFKFPEPFDNGIRLKDLLEKEVNEKYYINTEKANKLIEEFKANNKNNEQKILVCGKLNSSQDGIVCNPNGISPTHVAGHGNCPKVVCPCITPDRLNKRQNGRRFKTNDEPMFTLTAQDRHGILEGDVKILRNVRTEYGKQIRKDYENGNIEEKRSNMTMLEPRKDDITNTITTVTKDNLLLETNTLNFIGGIGEKDIVGDNKSLSRNYPQGNRVYDANNIACSQTANGGGIGGKTGLYLVGNLDGKYEQSNRVYSEEGIAPTIMSNSRKTCTGGYNSPKIMQIGMLDIKGNEQIRRVYNEEGISPTLNTMQGGNTQPKVMYKVRQATKQGYTITEEGDSINLEQPNSTIRRGRVGNKIANTLTCSCNQAVVNEYRIRKLTPLECYRLMGFDDEDFYKASALNSNSQLYKQAGNSICVNVLEEIFKNLF